jgi:hypothetical protein
MTVARLGLPVDLWPEVDRGRRRHAQTQRTSSSSVSARATGPGDPAYRREGLWPVALVPGPPGRPGCGLDARLPASEDCLRELLAELRAQMAPVSVAMRVGVLLRVLTVLDPGHDWPWLARAYAKPEAGRPAITQQARDRGGRHGAVRTRPAADDDPLRRACTPGATRRKPLFERLMRPNARATEEALVPCY